MPVKGYRKPGAKTEIIKFRVSVEQREAYEAAAEAAGYRDVSGWARSLCDAASGMRDARPETED